MAGSDTHFAEQRHRAVDLFVPPLPLLSATKYNMILLQTSDQLTFYPISDHMQKESEEDENNYTLLSHF